MQDSERVKNYDEEAIRLRRELHQIPEEGFDLAKTQAYLINYLVDLGYQPEKVCETGLILYIKGQCDDDAIAFRADMDALCIREEADHDYVSCHPGWMHACGHDGHMTMNLLLAKYLADFPDQRKRSVLLIFQPGEEGPGGAKPMIEAGIFEKYPVKAIFGYHLFPFIEEGMLATKAGPMMAQNSEFFITVRGISGHAAQPQRSMDAIVASASLITCLQSIVSRNTNPMESVVISIGLLNGGTRVNVVADEVKLGGTIRSFSNKSHEKLHRRIEEVVKGVELTHGCNIELEFIEMYPPVINNERLYEIYKELVPRENRVPFRKVMLSEDFSYFQSAVPGLYIGLGTGNEKKGYNKNLHTSGFNFDETVLLKGMEASLKLINYSKNY
ncbi:M20 family metallopeptidase [Acetobacterium sp. K1/6]|jgi:amidohydrolase|uniref:M20 metallopeptidase family protein n=1 Tax=Acetobacterium sp. K1/6 TaxID=3055467 RepID=UPI002ACB04AA|nr:M20 family metallopeptidase [Acetobacterium sp. K1/6]MDZ5726266.1 M20 family metallopeptidase [Acetobacterium sp. K1/6]